MLYKNLLRYYSFNFFLIRLDTRAVDTATTIF